MRTKQLFTKMLLVALCLIGGSSFAWGVTLWQTYKSWNFTGLTSSELSNYSGLTNQNNDGKTFYLNTSPFSVENVTSALYGLVFEGAYSGSVKGAFNTITSNEENRGFQLGGGAAKITIPDLKAGQRVTVTLNAEKGISSSQLSDLTTTGNVSVGTVSSDGDVVIARIDNTTTFVKSILVESQIVLTEVFHLDFENAETYANGWNATSANYDANVTQGDHSNGKAIHFSSKGSRGSTTTYSFESLEAFENATDYRIEFDFATCGGASGNNHEGGVKLYSGNNVVFSATIPAEWSSTLTITGASSTVSVAQRDTDPPTPWFHVVLTGNSTGLFATVTNTTASPNTTIVDNVKISDTPVTITSFVAYNARALHHLYIDDIVCYVNLEPLKTRASEALDVYNTIKNDVMNTTIKTSLDGAYSALAAFDTDEKITANINGYTTAISDIETAITNAKTSTDDFIILNDLIDNANTASIDDYVAPEGASTVYIANADVDPVALADAVRAAIITAGTATANTNISALIVNKGFELGSTLGWTIDGDPATSGSDADNNGCVVTTDVIGGSYTYYTGWNGRNVNQRIVGLPAGSYKLTAKARSWTNGVWRCTVALVANGGASDPVTMEGVNTDLEYTFDVTGNETYVNIGIAGTNEASSPYPNGGSWGYYCDDFTLTYVGQDELAMAKASLAEEIVNATELYNTWTPKVGTAPFKYDATYYNALNTKISAAQTVIDSDGDIVSAYTDAKDELETAEGNIANSAQNTPDPSKYYRIYVANNDGTASAFNLNMLKETTKTQVTVTATPYPVKILDNGSGKYNIKNPYDHNLCTDKDASTTAYVSSGEGVQSRSSELTISIQENGTLRISGTKSSTNYYYTASASEGAGVTAPTSSSSAGTWIISDAVDVTDVTLLVNATAGWGTFIAPYDNLKPETVKAYTVANKDNGRVYFEESEEDVLSANTPYILSTEEAENVSVALKGIATNGETATYTVNGLVGLMTAGSVPVGSYVMQYQNSNTAFYKVTDSPMTGTAYRCYLDLDNVPAKTSGARQVISFNVYGDDDTTGISQMENGKLRIGESVYNLNGQRIDGSRMNSGIYIHNGRKVVVK